MSLSLLSTVTREAKPLPPRIVLYAAEKFGKTSWAAHAWQPVFLMSPGETGLLSLLEAGRVPPTDHFPDDFQRWGDLLAAVRALRDDPHQWRTLVLDTGNGCEQLCAAGVCDDRFGGDWSEYAAYGRGNEQTSKRWAEFLQLLDEVRVKRRMAVVVLQHAKVKTFSDPAGKDWDQWRPEAIDKLWALTHKWADCILFGGFKTTVKNDKAVGEARYIRAEASGPVVAGNRYGLPAELTAAPGAANLWKAFADALGRAKKKAADPAATAPPPPPPPPPAAAANGKPATPPAPADDAAVVPHLRTQLEAELADRGLALAAVLTDHARALGIDPARHVPRLDELTADQLNHLLDALGGGPPPDSLFGEPEPEPTDIDAIKR